MIKTQLQSTFRTSSWFNGFGFQGLLSKSSKSLVVKMAMRPFVQLSGFTPLLKKPPDPRNLIFVQLFNIGQPTTTVSSKISEINSALLSVALIGSLCGSDKSRISSEIICFRRLYGEPINETLSSNACSGRATRTRQMSPSF
jgi:hypothetical protein